MSVVQEMTNFDLPGYFAAFPVVETSDIITLSNCEQIPVMPKLHQQAQAKLTSADSQI